MSFSNQDSTPSNEGMSERGFQPRDHDDLQLAADLTHWVSELVNGVMERRRLDLNTQTISFLSGAKADADNAEREIDMADKYVSWRASSLQVDSSAATDVEWLGKNQEKHAS